MKIDKSKIFIGIALIILFVVFFMGKQVVTAGEVNNQGVKLTVLVQDENGNLVKLGKQSFLQSTVSIAGGEQITDISQIYMGVEMTVDPTSTIPNGATIQVTDVTGEILEIPSDTRFNDAVISTYTSNFELIKGGSSDTRIVGPITLDNVVEIGDSIWRLNVEYNYYDSQGQSVSASTYGQLTINIVGDSCSDGTAWGACDGNGLYCSEGTLINCASPTGCTEYPTGCECQSDYQNNNGICDLMDCADGTLAGQCVGENAGYCDETTCSDGSCEVVQDCDLCSVANCGTFGQAGVIDGNSCNDQTNCYDYYGNSALSCNEGTCVFNDYTGLINIGLGGETETGGTEPPASYVNFRTGETDLLYDAFPQADSWIAYTEVCGQTLTGYGKYGSNENSGICSSVFGTGFQLLSLQVPGNIYLTSGSYTYKTGELPKVYKETSTGVLYFCQNINYGGSNYHVWVSYKAGYGYASNAITDSTSVSGYPEVTC